MTMGRPSKYRDEYCDMIVEHMAEGASAASFAASIDVCRDTITEWVAVHPDFSVAFKRGKAKCAAWWEKTNRSLSVGGSGNAASCIFGLKNMAKEDWNDRREVEHSGSLTLGSALDALPDD